MFEQMAKTNTVPVKDRLGMRASHIAVTGTTRPLDPEKYPSLKDKHGFFSCIIGEDKLHTWMVITAPGNRISYVILEQLDAKDSKKDIATLRSTRLTPEAKDKMIKDTYQLPINHTFREGLANVQDDHQRTMGELIENTDPDKISHILFEEQLLETWHYGRTNLSERILRMFITKLPNWLMEKIALMTVGYRPQVNFLPRVPDPPNLTIFQQKPSKRHM
ncbi:hypothetical protein BGZ65_007214 [Modicella reniformis]|uniref:Uncharacterized protein n=1 Tax=Modicella reniformis TaxID=1440133 RepID=A0A9P6JH38_9FUNG|nr:hypothetical protein BGZ65_007214 [Modicella reniformis]